MKRLKIVGIFLFIALLLLTGCSKKEEAKKPGAESSKISIEDQIGNPQDYVPTETGRTFRYKITIGDTEPLIYREMFFPQGKDRVSITALRGRFLSIVKNPKKKTFFLELKIKGPATKQGGLKYPIGVEYEIVEDELGIFQDANKVFLAATNSGRFSAFIVTTYPPDRLGTPGGSWGGWGAEDGFSMRRLFFGDSPGTEIGMGEKPIDKLLFVGLREVPDKGVFPSLHFSRKVDSDVREGKIAWQGFSEETWFVRGTGLVRLEQKVQGKTSMIWELLR
jgi:hypothetical protein